MARRGVKWSGEHRGSIVSGPFEIAPQSGDCITVFLHEISRLDILAALWPQVRQVPTPFQHPLY
uniref:Uncharacterized protein n=1 Tax=Magnetococcus massalia (strain MO-1) TaxID=451514 RepID=A0A1S7LET7_MAGMO|nr:protein of unknown function [Candidatus Magnetococcus massalia]